MSANAPTHLLRGQINRWNEWRAESSDGSSTSGGSDHPDVSGVDLSGLDLSGANLARASLIEANLSSARLREAGLAEADLTNADLAGADLSNAQLDSALLRLARLENANLSNANFFSADLSSADLRGTNLQHANLHRAMLTEADLSRADLTNADLSGSVLSRAIVAEANMTRATMGFTDLGGVDLGDVIGLDSIRHAGPSHLGIDTAYQSRNGIPAEFLVGCGIPGVMIDYLPSLTTPLALQFYSGFISYSHADVTPARQLEAYLRGQQISVWRDEHALLPGDDIDRRIDAAIKRADRILLLCSESSLNSWWVDREMGRANQRERALYDQNLLPEGVRLVIPIDLDGYLFSDECRSLHAASLTAGLVARVRVASDGSVDEQSLAPIAEGMRDNRFRLDVLPPSKFDL